MGAEGKPSAGAEKGPPKPLDDSEEKVLSPADAWPFPSGEVRTDEFADVRLIRVADTFAGESRRIRFLQGLVLTFGALVVAVLLWFLYMSIDRGFNGHLKSTEQILVKVASKLAPDASAAAASALPPAAKAEPQPKVDQGKAKKEAKHAEVQASTASIAETSLHELLSSGVKAIASTTVAVIWVLVIAIAVITISIARAVLSLKPQGLEGGDGEKDSKPDSGAAISLPGLDFAKEVIKLVVDTAQSIRK